MTLNGTNLGDGLEWKRRKPAVFHQHFLRTSSPYHTPHHSSIPRLLEKMHRAFQTPDTGLTVSGVSAESTSLRQE